MKKNIVFLFIVILTLSSNAEEILINFGPGIVAGKE